MKLMILTNNPTRASFRLRIEDYLDDLRQQGIDSEVFAMPPTSFQRWRLFQRSRRFDAVLIHRKCLNIRDALMLSVFRRKLLFDFDDAIMHSPTRPDSDRTSHYRLFRRTAKMMDVMIAGNETLADYARRYCNRVYVLPTGLDMAAYVVPGVPKDPDTIRLVWIGSQSTLPYLAQLRPVFEQIGRAHGNVVLRIIADAFFDLEHMRVEKCPWTLQTQARDLAACDIGLSPLPDDRFTRGKCGFKMLQYFAAGLPVIASPVGVNETFVQQSGAGLTATSPDQWQPAIENLICDLDARRTLGDNGRRFVQAFDKSRIAEQLGRIINSLL